MRGKKKIRKFIFFRQIFSDASGVGRCPLRRDEGAVVQNEYNAFVFFRKCSTMLMDRIDIHVQKRFFTDREGRRFSRRLNDG
jgi:hypothetical protein